MKVYTNMFAVRVHVPFDSNLFKWKTNNIYCTTADEHTSVMCADADADAEADAIHFKSMSNCNNKTILFRCVFAVSHTTFKRIFGNCFECRRKGEKLGARNQTKKKEKTKLFERLESFDVIATSLTYLCFIRTEFTDRFWWLRSLPIYFAVLNFVFFFFFFQQTIKENRLQSR